VPWSFAFFVSFEVFNDMRRQKRSATPNDIVIPAPPNPVQMWTFSSGSASNHAFVACLE